MREVLEKFDFDNTISKLDEGGLLFQVLERFKNVDLHPDRIDNPTMGTIFEELLRKFNEALNENPGEHFTPRDVVHLMVELMLAGEGERIRRKGIVCTVYDPCCGSGGMLMISKEHVTAGWRRNGESIRAPINPSAEIHLFGQEVNPETWAVSKSDLFMKDPTGRDADNIAYGSVLSNDRHAGRGFDYLIANPPYGKDWKRDEDAVRAEHGRGASGRFAAGLPRISDGQLLFLLHMLAHAKEPKDGGSRIAIIMNGSPLFTGDAGSGESEIRRFILDNDLLEALIALPEQLFYNTGIATYVWVVSNRKTPARRRKVQLIDASAFWVPMRKSLGDKRREIPPERAQDIVKLRADFKDGDARSITKDGKEEEVVVSRIFPTTHFGFRKITVERPLRLNFHASAARAGRLDRHEEARRSRRRRHRLRDQLQPLDGVPTMPKCATETEGSK
jgi:type I restriction enzyme M protein